MNTIIKLKTIPNDFTFNKQSDTTANEDWSGRILWRGKN
jgi:hypothetical protein